LKQSHAVIHLFLDVICHLQQLAINNLFKFIKFLSQLMMLNFTGIVQALDFS